MRIALLHPTYWPEVRRGSERVVHDLGAELSSRGHDVTLLTSHRGWPSRVVEDGFTVARAWRPPELPGLTMHEYHLTNVPAAIWRLARGSYDVAHAFFPIDAWAAVEARRFGGPPVVASLHGTPTREYLVARRYRLQMLQRVVAEADECTVLSEAAAVPFRRYLFHDPRVLPPGVVADDFGMGGPRATRPTLFCASSLGDPRKRPGMLFAALRSVRERMPDLRLRIAAPKDPVMSGAPPTLPAGAEEIAVTAPDVLAREYASAWVTVNPGVGEAFGLVLIESLAAGTPIVADTSGAAPEILDGADVGRLFAPDDEGDLARAIGEALELASAPGVREACRRRALEYDWSASIADRYEHIYQRVGRGSLSASSRGGD